MWIVHIWTKPFASWTLIDVIGALIVAPLVLTLLWFGVMALFALAVGIVAAVQTMRWFEWLFLGVLAAGGIWVLLERLGILALQ